MSLRLPVDALASKLEYKDFGFLFSAGKTKGRQICRPFVFI